MTNQELTLLNYNLAYDLAEHSANKINIMNKGLSNSKLLFVTYLLSVYVEIINQYNVDMIMINPLTSDEMTNILHHTNVILNKNYSYDFKEGGFVF